MPSIVAQSTPPARAAALRCATNFGDRRSAGGGGSGSGELSHTVAALAGPSISGFGAGFVFGGNTQRRCSVRARARRTAVCRAVSLCAEALGVEAAGREAPEGRDCRKAC